MEPPQRVRRTANACKQCRSRKVKCSGTQPCDKCQFRRQNCVFEEDRKITVSEELFLSLKRKVDHLEGSASPGNKRLRTSRDVVHSYEPTTPRAPTSPRVLSSPGPQRGDERFASNPLVSPSRYIQHTGRRQRKWLLLGPTSTWSFSRRVLSIIQDRLHPGRSSPIPLAVDGDAYQLHWSHASSEEPPDISGLPSLEYALYLLNTVKFRLNPLYRLFDEDEFLRNLYAFYEDSPRVSQESRLWYVQYLVILAFGEAFLIPVRTVSNTSGWTKYFTRAMSLLPDTTGLWNDPLLAIEVLALIALYFHSVDMRDTAYCYIGHSMRMSLVEGHHLALPVDQLGEKLVERCNTIWWTVYILERKFSSLIGAPNSVHDEDITAALWDPKSCSPEAAALSLHVKISQVISRVLNTVYGADGKLGGAYLRRVRTVLEEMTDLSKELEDVFAHRFRNSVDALSGVTTRLTLSCYSCIIVTIRPLILNLLWERLSCFEEGDTFRTLSGPVQTLIEACIDSAIKSLKILTALRDHNLLESFLPFDLENLFSASFILCLISVILPDFLTDHTYRDMGFNLLDEMIARGSQVARMRKSDIELLEEMIQPLQRPPQELPKELPHRLDTPLSQERDLPQGQPPDPVSVMLPDPGQDDDLLFNWGDFGMSLNQMLSATDQLNASHTGDADLQADLWLWSDDP